MTQELGKMEKPLVEEYKTGRKLYFVPLLFTTLEAEAELSEKVNRYWEQVETQIASLEVKLGSVKKIYHELIPVGGEDGAKAIEGLNKGSYQIAKARLEKGAELQPIEDAELLTEFMDWSGCLAIGLQNQKVFTTVYESYREAQKRRSEYIAKQIDETLKDSEIGILLMREGHQVQYPIDIQVFYISPPGLDEIKRWLRDREAGVQNRSSNEGSVS